MSISINNRVYITEIHQSKAHVQPWLYRDALLVRNYVSQIVIQTLKKRFCQCSCSKIDSSLRDQTNSARLKTNCCHGIHSILDQHHQQGYGQKLLCERVRLKPSQVYFCSATSLLMQWLRCTPFTFCLLLTIFELKLKMMINLMYHQGMGWSCTRFRIMLTHVMCCRLLSRV